jgi:hypothetical protein
MLKLVSENPLKFENENGDEVPVQTAVCSVHNTEVKFCVDSGVKVIVQTQNIDEFSCDAWK